MNFDLGVVPVDFAGFLGQDLASQISDVVNDLFIFSSVDKSTGDDVGIADQLTRSFADIDENDDYTFFRQNLTITQDDIADVADAEAVDHDVLDGNLAGLANGSWIHLE